MSVTSSPETCRQRGPEMEPQRHQHAWMGMERGRSKRKPKTSVQQTKEGRVFEMGVEIISRALGKQGEDQEEEVGRQPRDL